MFIGKERSLQSAAIDFSKEQLARRARISNGFSHNVLASSK